ncbi:recombinase family protein [Paenibacillaceae bacterium WGS1546]|uniref:recombinase family protein n=1 Tax=Cohnella sp. WGS1546 TaxID=3366810 RepID=UPI00372D754E
MAMVEEKLVQPWNVVSKELIEKNLKLIKKLMAEGKSFKRIAALYRVSSKKQLTRSDHGEDIPTQRNACLNYIEQQTGWYLVKEYTEKGVSGFKKKSADRGELQQIMKDATNKEFDVLLVFMLDRIGRLDKDSSGYLEDLVDMAGVEVWSVKEGQIKFEQHGDRLMNYIHFWQSQGESLKTSARVDEAHSQMVGQGQYRGGSVPFGYKLVPSGKYNKKGKELLKMAIDEEEAAVIRQIFDWVDLEGYGQYVIPRMLNEKGIKTKKGKPWGSTTISSILRNPTFMGYTSYARGKEKEVRSKTANPDLIIISEEKWNRVQAIRAGRNPEMTKKHGVEPMVKMTKGELILVGIVKCGHCGNPLSPTSNNKKYKRSDGTEVKKKYVKYRCFGKGSQKAIDCEGQTTYSKDRIEAPVIDEVLGYLDRLEKVDLTQQLQALKKQNTAVGTSQLQRLSKELDDAYEDMKSYKAEVIKSIKGTGRFSSEVLNELIEDTSTRIAELEEQVTQARREVEAKRIERKELETLQQHIPDWRLVFDQASPQQKRMMLRTIIGRVDVFRNEIKVYFKLKISQFIGTMGVEVGNQVDVDKVIE